MPSFVLLKQNTTIIFPDQTTVLLEGNGKRCERLHPMMSHMSSRESKSPVISTTHDGNTRQTF